MAMKVIRREDVPNVGRSGELVNVKPGFGRNYRRAMAEGAAVTFEDYFPPHRRWYEVHAYGSPEGLSVYFRDVTERRRADEALREAARRKDEFLALLGH